MEIEVTVEDDDWDSKLAWTEDQIEEFELTEEQLVIHMESGKTYECDPSDVHCLAVSTDSGEGVGKHGFLERHVDDNAHRVPSE